MEGVSENLGLGDSMNRREAIARTIGFLGIAVSASTFSGLLAADRSSLGVGLEWTPVHLSKSQANIVSVASEIVLPRSDTPGAQDVGVPQFIDFMFGKFMSVEQRQRFVEGLALFERSGFLTATEEVRIDLVKGVTEETRGFVRHLRELILLGYFTSEEIARDVLKYEPIPGKYVGCVTIGEKD